MKQRAKVGKPSASDNASAVQLWPVAKLKSHPRQAELFDDLPEPQFIELVENIERHGVQTPIEIDTDGTIICGHQRAKAAQRLQMLKVPVIIRSDLETLGDNAILERMVSDNTVRRQLDPLSTARAYRVLKDSYSSRNCERSQRLDGDLRDALAQRFNCSGRTLDRLERLLDLPRAVQTAISNNLLAADLASRLFGVDESVRELVAKRISKGEKPDAVIRELLPYKRHRVVHAGSAFYRLIVELHRATIALEGKFERLGASPEDRRTLQAGRALIDELIEKVPQSD